MKALALFSGGLDSVLAMKLIKDQGIDVIAVHINIGFGSLVDRTAHMRNMCDQIGVKLELVDLRQLYLDEVLFSPKYGYGKNFNPCIDCHGFMFRYTGKLLEKFDASFMISGEVVGQRPMSQRKEALDQVRALSEHDELIVRPLCAKHLSPSRPELEGWIDREKLLDIQGRTRHRQLELAQEIGLKDFESPGGGCLLTDIQFSNRLRDFVAHDTLEILDIDTLKAGRHLRLEDGLKVIIGRDKDDNKKLQQTQSKKYLQARVVGAVGPYCLVAKDGSSSDMQFAANLIVTYAKTNLDQTYEVEFKNLQTQEIFIINATKYPSKDIASKYFVN
ncbi:MAG: 7-cyano-7-deazaguanine synthase [Campylobacterales bacterium]|nr:7-cyano-7-deazaguanine synthase [Campylobacterales bacterium]